MEQKHNELLERVLSKNISDEFGKFFTSVLEQVFQFSQKDQARHVFIVVITRRCFVLFFSYYEMLCQCIRDPDSERPAYWKEFTEEKLRQLARTFDRCVITDNAAWSMAYDIVRNYKENSAFPRLIVVDELLFHGRALNGFLYGFEKRLLHAEYLYQASQHDLSFSGSSIQVEFLDKLTIRVANWNMGSSVLLPRYQKILDKSNPESSLPIEDWRNHSIAYAQYVSICGINNVGFTMGISIPTQHEPTHPRHTDSSFTKITTKLQNIKQDTWL